MLVLHGFSLSPNHIFLPVSGVFNMLPPAKRIVQCQTGSNYMYGFLYFRGNSFRYDARYLCFFLILFHQKC